MFPEHPEHGIIKVCAGRKGTPSKGFSLDVFGWEADKRKMVVVELVFAGLLIYGIFLSVGRIRKDLLQLRRKRIHEKRVKAMLSESNPFFARRICRWIDHPEKDPDLTWAVQCGKYPSLLVYLKKAANQNR